MLCQKHLEVTIAIVQGDLATAQVGCRPWHHPREADFASMQNARITLLWRLAPRFQRKAREVRQCVAGSVFLQEAPEKTIC
jgi:hypothetical protein